MATVLLTEADDRYYVRAIDDLSEDIFVGLGGNDTFIIDQYVSNISISGTNGAGEDANDYRGVIELWTSAQFNYIHAIDVLMFSSPLQVRRHRHP
jgi:hypothetical protein